MSFFFDSLSASHARMMVWRLVPIAPLHPVQQTGKPLAVGHGHGPTGHHLFQIGCPRHNPLQCGIPLVGQEIGHPALGIIRSRHDISQTVSHDLLILPGRKLLCFVTPCSIALRPAAPLRRTGPGSPGAPGHGWVGPRRADRLNPDLMDPPGSHVTDIGKSIPPTQPEIPEGDDQTGHMPFKCTGLHCVNRKGIQLDAYQPMAT